MDSRFESQFELEAAEYDVILCTAWDLIGDLSSLWLTGTYGIYVVGGTRAYEDARNTRGGNVRLARLDAGAGFWSVKQTNRYVSFDQPIELRRNGENAHGK